MGRVELLPEPPVDVGLERDRRRRRANADRDRPRAAWRAAARRRAGASGRSSAPPLSPAQRLSAGPSRGRATSPEPSFASRRGAAPGATPANRAPARSASGATSTSARLRSIARTIAAATVLRRARADAGRQRRAGVGEHPGVADEAREDAGDADAVVREVLPQRQREAAQPELRRRVERRARLAALPESEETKTRWPRPRSTIALASSRREHDRRAQVDVEHAVDLVEGRTTSSSPAAGQRGVGDEHVDVARAVGERSAGPSGSARSAAIARPPISAASASSTSARRPLTITAAPRARRSARAMRRRRAPPRRAA